MKLKSTSKNGKYMITYQNFIKSVPSFGLHTFWAQREIIKQLIINDLIIQLIIWTVFLQPSALENLDLLRSRKLFNEYTYIYTTIVINYVHIYGTPTLTCSKIKTVKSMIFFPKSTIVILMKFWSLGTRPTDVDLYLPKHNGSRVEKLRLTRDVVLKDRIP